MRPSFWYAAALVVLWSGVAGAQVRYDAGLLAGFSQRVSDVAEGGALTLDAHVALLPLLRVGAYVSGEVSERTSEPSVRGLIGGGLSLKVVPPWPRGTWRAWVRTGFGYDGVFTVDPSVGGGGFFEVPVFVGASYRIRKPVVFLMELGARFGFATWGSYYATSTRTDGVALMLSFGVGIDR